MTADLTIYSTPWCGHCHRLKGQLSREGIVFVDVDIDQEPDAADYVAHVNGGLRTVPTVTFPDGTTLTNPSLAEVKRRL